MLSPFYDAADPSPSPRLLTLHVLFLLRSLPALLRPLILVTLFLIVRLSISVPLPCLRYLLPTAVSRYKLAPLAAEPLSTADL